MPDEALLLNGAVREFRWSSTGDGPVRVDMSMAPEFCRERPTSLDDVDCE